jgi:hypothetical protein
MSFLLLGHFDFFFQKYVFVLFFSNDKNLGFHMRYHFFLHHYGSCFFKILEKRLICTLLYLFCALEKFSPPLFLTRTTFLQEYFLWQIRSSKVLCLEQIVVYKSCDDLSLPSRDCCAKFAICLNVCFMTIFCNFLPNVWYLQQNWSSDSHFEVLNGWIL